MLSHVPRGAPPVAPLPKSPQIITALSLQPRSAGPSRIPVSRGGDRGCNTRPDTNVSYPHHPKCQPSLKKKSEVSIRGETAQKKTIKDFFFIRRKYLQHTHRPPTRTLRSPLVPSVHLKLAIVIPKQIQPTNPHTLQTMHTMWNGGAD